jgi:D-lactate dehydratase
MTILSKVHNIFCRIMPLPRRALIAITSATAPLHDGKPTGMFISEALHPYNVFTAAGFEVDIVSETGKYAVDWLSTTPDFLGEDLKKTWEDSNSGFRKKIDHLPDVQSLDGKDVSRRCIVGEVLSG